MLKIIGAKKSDNMGNLKDGHELYHQVKAHEALVLLVRHASDFDLKQAAHGALEKIFNGVSYGQISHNEITIYWDNR